MSKEVTRWFPATIHPARVGWYEASFYGLPDVRRRYWDGKQWTFGDGHWTMFGSAPQDQWRGLAKNPQEAK
jgi:hypothetical protein